MALVGVGLIVVGFGFKLALVPFHLWTPDVYQGAPAPVTAFIATVSKGAMFALLLRYFTVIDVRGPSHVVPDLRDPRDRVDGGGQPAGAVAEQRQTAARLLVDRPPRLSRRGVPGERSPRGHSDHVLPGGVLRHDDRRLRRRHGAVECATARRRTWTSTGACFARRPWLSAVFMAMLLSLAGIPLTAGFVGKFYLTVAAGGAALWSLLIVMMVTSGIGLFYYLRIIVAMFMESATDASAGREPSRLPFVAGLTLSALTVALVWLGVYPAPLIRLIRVAVTGGG